MIQKFKIGMDVSFDTLKVGRIMDEEAAAEFVKLALVTLDGQEISINKIEAKEDKDEVEWIELPWSSDAKEQGFEGCGWFFWDETRQYCYGPYPTKERAEQEKNEYAVFLERGGKAII